MREIALTQGYVAWIDDEDFERISEWNWQIARRRKSVALYASGALRINGKRKMMLLHRFIINAPDGYPVDHIDGNGLNCQRANLRVCSTTENLRNRGIQKNNSSGFKGVAKAKNRWRATLQKRIEGKRRQICLGLYDDPAEAARAYDIAALIHHGEFARLNFPAEAA